MTSSEGPGSIQLHLWCFFFDDDFASFYRAKGSDRSFLFFIILVQSYHVFLFKGNPGASLLQGFGRRARRARKGVGVGGAKSVSKKKNNVFLIPVSIKFSRFSPRLILRLNCLLETLYINTK